MSDMQKKALDCLLIGHNEGDFINYEKELRQMGVQSIAYRDLNLDFLEIGGQPMPLTGILNTYCLEKNNGERTFRPLSFFDSFSATIAYLGTYLHRRGLTFDYIHSYQKEKERLGKMLQEGNILSVAITTTYYVHPRPVAELVRWIKKYNQTAQVIIGGPFITKQLSFLRDPESIEYLFQSLGADIYVNSPQGEEALVRIIGAVKGNQPFSGIDNIYFKTSQGYQGTPVAAEENMLSANRVEWELFANRIGRYANVRTSISCPYSCAFCGFPAHAGAYQTMPVSCLEEELDQLQAMESVQGVKFIDDTFNVPAERFQEILRMMIKKKYRFKWFGNFRCQFADEKTVALMKESGCECVFLGLESGSNDMLRNMRKHTATEQYRKGIALLKEQNILTFGSFIIGFPGETGATVAETARFIEECGIDFYRANLWYCEPGTPVWQEGEKYELRGGSYEWNHSTMDSHEACDWVEELMASVKNSSRVPLHGFDIESIWHLLHQGFSLNTIHRILGVFNRSVRDKLRYPDRKQDGDSIIRKFQAACFDDPASGRYGENPETSAAGKCVADFNLD